MNKIHKFFHYLLYNRTALALAIITRLAPIIPDKPYLKLLFRLKMGYKLDLSNPRTFNEKLQWLKLYDRKPEYTVMVDKYAVKQHIADLIGDEYIIPTLGVWDKFDDIDFDRLPERFVLKTTNGGGSTGVIICKDKSQFDKTEARKRLTQSLRTSIYTRLREWPYKNVKPRIIAEQYMEDESGELRDYKFHCFDGKAENVMVCCDRNTGDTKFYFFSQEWNLLPINKRGKATDKNFKLPKPECMDEMFEIAGKLSEGMPFLRVDLYSINGRPYFGETTFFPQSGLDPNLLPETDLQFGDKIKLEKMI